MKRVRDLPKALWEALWVQGGYYKLNLTGEGYMWFYFPPPPLRHRIRGVFTGYDFLIRYPRRRRKKSKPDPV